ncbi:phosphoadenosine phosphosulfate reductase family protein [Pantoea allii]|uniref:phosphoadenosine phosphosulfate reductase domain-containing protein n=1 Tax=Pantoea TaxID=53335 RepID=UPI001588DC01|nr:phosphoadenosine phosphosulfate reductase family protein [Pantoea ananatis]MBA4822482.1 phosphoadenosine phosphosulfate reductase family protein [Pantoea ananatis]QKV87663.1 phosphoadenosine phosphosulfate reductase family protein [Pantoea ananatis]
MKEPMVVSFSGGQSSGFLCDFLLQNYLDAYDFHFVFANTGREHPETLIFADKVDKLFGLNLVWLEGVTSPEHGVGMSHKIVTFETASRNGEPFEQLISVEGIPNVSRQKCSDYLKTQTIRSWMRANNLARHGWSAKTAIGMRADEPERAAMGKASTKRYNLVYPLCHWGSFDKQDVNDFWDAMPFKLNIPAHYGNCLTCFKKSNAKLYLIAHEHPEWFAWNRDMEILHGKVKAREGHTWWRGKRNTDQLIQDAQLQDKQRLIYLTKSSADDGDGCTSSCEPFQNVEDDLTFEKEDAA